MSKRRPNGDGMVRKRPDGRWEARIIVGHKENGKPIYKSVFGKTQSEAMTKFYKLLETYRGVELNEDCLVNLNEWLDRWLCYQKAATIQINIFIHFGFFSFVKCIIDTAI